MAGGIWQLGREEEMWFVGTLHEAFAKKVQLPSPWYAVSLLKKEDSITEEGAKHQQETQLSIWAKYKPD